MTQRSRIFSKLAGTSKLACAALLASRLVSASTVTGTVELTGNSGHAQASRESLTDIVVWLQPVQNTPLRAPEAQHAQLLQKDKMFHPHVLAITVGSVVDFPNVDPIFHNAFSNFDGQLFDVGLYPPGTSRTVHFYRAGIVRVFCNIHPSMSAVIVVLSTPFFTKVRRDGKFDIPDVPPGVYELHVFDERATERTDAESILTVEVDRPQITAEPIRISEAGYVRPPHKNKYGLDYPVSSADLDTYSGPPR